MQKKIKFFFSVLEIIAYKPVSGIYLIFLTRIDMIDIQRFTKEF